MLNKIRALFRRQPEPDLSQFTHRITISDAEIMTAVVRFKVANVEDTEGEFYLKIGGNGEPSHLYITRPSAKYRAPNVLTFPGSGHGDSR